MASKSNDKNDISNGISYERITFVTIFIFLICKIMIRPEIDLNATEIMVTNYMKSTPTGSKLLSKQSTPKELFPSGSKWNSYPLIGSTIVITGATSGIGKSLATTVHGLGATVIAIGRSRSKLSQLQLDLEGENPNKSRLVPILADLSDLASVAEAANQIQKKVKSIDILVNNAGIHYGSDIFSTKAAPMETKQGYDLVFGVNYLSHFLLTEKLLPVLERSKLQPRIIQISSSFHFMMNGSELKVQPDQNSPVASQSHSQTFTHKNRSYANSKLAQLYHMRALDRRLVKKNSNIKIISVCPAWVQTDIAGRTGKLLLNRLGGYPVEDVGISSSLNAMFLPDLGGVEADYLAQIPLIEPPFPQKPDFLVKWIDRLLIRDLLAHLAADGMLMVQNFLFRQKLVMRSSVESYNEETQESLYKWSENAISSFV